MRKIVSIIAASLVTCSISACGNKNTAYRTPNTNQGGTNISMNQDNYNNTAAYKDGLYLGEGNRTSMGNQAAIVTVNGGRITNVVLKTLDAQGKEVYSSGANTNISNNDTTINNGTVGGTTAGGANTNGTTNGTNVGGTITNDVNSVRNSVTNTLDAVRRNLAGAVVSQQTHNVTINSTGSDTASVNNWKLAISRALENARR